MNRRGFLGALFALPAAIKLAKFTPPKAEALLDPRVHYESVLYVGAGEIEGPEYARFATLAGALGAAAARAMDRELIILLMPGHAETIA